VKRWRKRPRPGIATPTTAVVEPSVNETAPDEPPAEWFEEWLRERERREQDEMRADVHRRYVERRDSGERDWDEGLEQV
jgi:hypothetical protein